MSHQNQRGTKISIQIEQQIYYFGARLSIEITGGLIRKQNLRIGRKSARNCYPLLLTACGAARSKIQCTMSSE